MPNRDNLNYLYNRFMGSIYSDLMGEAADIYRPNYSILDNEASLVYSKLITRLDPASRKFAETAFIGPKYYSIFTNRNIIQPGDVIVASGTYNAPRLDRPFVTYLHEGTMKEAVGIRTPQKCHIASGKNQDTGAFTYVAKNVWYDILDSGTTLGNINPGVPYSDRVPGQYIVFYNRTNLFLTPRMTVIDIDPTTGNETGYYWIIQQADRSGQLIVLSVVQNFSNY